MLATTRRCGTTQSRVPGVGTGYASGRAVSWRIDELVLWVAELFCLGPVGQHAAEAVGLGVAVDLEVATSLPRLPWWVAVTRTEHYAV